MFSIVVVISFFLYLEDPKNFHCSLVRSYPIIRYSNRILPEHDWTQNGKNITQKLCCPWHQQQLQIRLICCCSSSSHSCCCRTGFFRRTIAITTRANQQHAKSKTHTLQRFSAHMVRPKCCSSPIRSWRRNRRETHTTHDTIAVIWHTHTARNALENLVFNLERQRQ